MEGNLRDRELLFSRAVVFRDQNPQLSLLLPQILSSKPGTFLSFFSFFFIFSFFSQVFFLKFDLLDFESIFRPYQDKHIDTIGII